MAAVMDVSLIGFIQPLFIFLLVFGIGYGLLEKTSPFGEGKRAIHLIMAFSIAAVTIVVNRVSNIMGEMIPWIVLVVAIALFIFTIYGFFGWSNKRVWGLIGHTPLLLVLLGVVAIVLALTFEDFLTPYDNSASVGDASPDGTIDISVATNTSLGTSAVSTGDGSRDPTSETLKAITSPKIFGALLLLLITAAAAKLIVDKLGTSGEIE